jgi:hypothetical protein
MGGGAEFRVDGPIPPISKRLRAIARDPGGLHYLAFVILMLKNVVEILT